MTPENRFAAVFRQLRPILAAYETGMVVKHDEAEAYYLDSRHVMKNGQSLFFGGVEIKKKYVSFHLMPVYAFPELLDDIGDLKRRMQGKSCFNFRRIDDAQIAELVRLTRAGYERYRDEGMLE